MHVKTVFETISPRGLEWGTICAVPLTLLPCETPSSIFPVRGVCVHCRTPFQPQKLLDIHTYINLQIVLSER